MHKLLHTSAARMASRKQMGGLAPQKKFRIYQRALTYTGAPTADEFRQKGIGFAREFYNLASGPVVQANVEAGINSVWSANADIWFSDIESSTYTYDVANAAAAIAAHTNVTTWARNQKPDGIYGTYGGGQNGMLQSTFDTNVWSEGSIATMRANNDALQSIGAANDYLSFFAYNLDNIHRWQSYVNQALSEYARLKYTKPCLAWLQMFYAPGSVNPSSGLVDPTYWRAMLEYLYRQPQCTGVIIWGGSGAWNATAPWYLETLSFINDYAIQYVKAP